MTDLDSNAGTPKPGKMIQRPEARIWTDKLIDIFRPKTGQFANSNVPTACLIGGQEIDPKVSGFPINGDLFVFAYFENINELYYVRMADLASYIAQKEPWEDYDICVFDQSLAWCLAFTHNDQVKWVQSV